MSSLGRNSEPEGPTLASLTDTSGLFDHQPALVQHGELTAAQGASQPTRSVLPIHGVDEDISIAPKPNDVVIVGATKDEVGFDATVTAGGALHLLSSATRLIPALSSCPIIHMWAGLRPKGKQSYPLFGQIPSWENVMVASGHGGFGILLSTITGEAFSELMRTTPGAYLSLARERMNA